MLPRRERRAQHPVPSAASIVWLGRVRRWLRALRCLAPPRRVREASRTDLRAQHLPSTSSAQQLSDGCRRRATTRTHQQPPADDTDTAHVLATPAPQLALPDNQPGPLRPPRHDSWRHEWRGLPLRRRRRQLDALPGRWRCFLHEPLAGAAAWPCRGFARAQRLALRRSRRVATTSLRGPLYALASDKAQSAQHSRRPLAAPAPPARLRLPAWTTPGPPAAQPAIPR